MKWLFLRHAYAGESYNKKDIMADFRRELTGAGIEELKGLLRDAAGHLQGIETIYTSPLVRAVQTAEILYSFIPTAKLEILPELDKLCAPELAQRKLYQIGHTECCFVGHDPHLSALLKLLGFPSIQLEKSGLVLVEGDSIKGLKLRLLLAPKF